MSRIVVGVDGSTHADRALRWAVREAELLAAEIELVHGYVIHPYSAVVGTSDRTLAEARMDAIIEHNQSVLDRTKWSATLVPLIASPTGALLDAGEDADLIVVGSRGLGGFRELFLGATSYRTAAHAASPVAVVRGEAETADGSRAIVVGIDGSRASGRALQWALDEADRRDVDVTVVHSYEAPVGAPLNSVMSQAEIDQYSDRIHRDAVELVDETLADSRIPDGVTVERVVTRGTPASVLLDRAGNDRLLVVGTRGHSALGRMVFGSVGHQCLHHATGPVIVVP